MAEIFRLSLRQLLGRWRVLLIVVLASLPVLVVLLIRLLEGDRLSDGSHLDEEFVNSMIDGMIIGGVMPLVAMTLATAAFGNEIEDKTLHFLVLKPVLRVHIVLSKLLASFVLAVPVVVASGVVSTALAGAEGRTIIAVAIALAVGVAAYASVFTWAGLITSRALAYGLVYVLVWEGLLSTFLSGVRYLSIRGYTLAFLHGIDGEGFEVLATRVIEFPAALVGVAGATLAFFFLSQYRLRTMDIP